MAKKYTRAEWDALQASLPAEDRMTYAEYIGLLENFKAVEAASGTPVTVIVDEQVKAAAAKADTAAQKAAAAKAAASELAATALRKLQSNQTLTDAEKKALGIAVTTTTTSTPTQVLTQEQGRLALIKLQSGQPLTDAEKAYLGIGGTPAPTTTSGTPAPTPTPTTTGNPPTPTPTTTGVTPTPTVTTTTGGTTTPVPTLTTTQTPTLTTTQKPGGFTYTATDGTPFTDQAAYVAYQKMLNDKKLSDAAVSAAGAAERQSAYDLLYAEFSKYGLGSLVEPLRGLIQSGASPAEFAIKLRESDAYKKRFSANSARIAKGLKAISEAEYIGLEDQYQSILRNAGLPDTYWKTGDMGVQEGFNNFIANDVSAVELEDRVTTAQQRLIYANPEVSIALKTFYPDITNGDLLAYALDPTKGLDQIKRRITAAEIGSSAVQMGLATNVTDAEYLARYGVNKAQAQQGYRTAAEVLPTASKLGDIYSKQGLGPYTQQTAEQEIFNVPGAAEAAAKRKKLASLEQASFSGKTGAAQGALARERAGNF